MKTVNNISFALDRKKLIVSFTKGAVFKGAYGDVNPWRLVNKDVLPVLAKRYKLNTQALENIHNELLDIEKKETQAKLAKFFKNGLK